MHICFLTNEYPKEGFPHGGLGSFVKTMANALVKNNIKVSVVGLNYTNEYALDTENEITIYRLKKSRIKGLAWFFNAQSISKKIKEIHKNNPIDIVESAELGLAFLPKIKEIKYTIRLHGGHHFFAESENRNINGWKGFQEKRSFSKADAFIAVSKYVKEHTSKFLSYHNKKVEVIYNPIDAKLFSPLLIEPEDNNITFMGTVCEKKGVRQLIQAFPIIKKQFPKAVLNIYGRDWKYPDGKSYIERLKEIELPKIKPFDKEVIFHGRIDLKEIPLRYAKAAVCVFPSHMETLGLVAPEAMAMEKTVVFTKLGPGPEVIKEGVTGFLCDPKNPEDIANKIKEVLSNPNKAKEIGSKAREAVLNQFEINTIVKENITFYQNIS
ncbi:glycosyltransferase family 4 protein [uncultured Flavobacterium sp.]|uniref:glycosyltransferase family 4 protein n=1 Tax=uncultured Flavobacterium sp. TaxID=165435 RepID=UPI0030C843FC